MRANMMKEVERFKRDRGIAVSEEGSQRLDQFLRVGMSEDVRFGVSRVITELDEI